MSKAKQIIEELDEMQGKPYKGEVSSSNASQLIIALNEKMSKELLNLVKEVMKDKNFGLFQLKFDYNKKVTEFKDEVLRQAKAKGLEATGIDVMQTIDKVVN